MATSSLYHSVYFWLREGGTAKDTRKIVEAGQTYLAGIPGIVKMTVGVPASTSGGPVDNSYSVVLLIEFENKAALDVYDTHPNHLRFIEECKDLWSRVQVYDAVPA
jgi:hypothetical protein